ncbi:GTPase IMAP family member 4-like [Mytilus trossulus]|uniref:GTPase IMAP family member 4-like n=1 Tax=Mytilus trossulus TaxID=6551 RepID=UPI0030074CB8
MIGKTGGGKSSTGNTMMGHRWFESSSSSESVTQKGKTGKIRWKDQYIKIVDTPGLFDNLMEDDDLKLELIKCMTLVVPGPHIIMYMIRIGRYTKEDIEAAEKFLKIIGENLYNWTIIVLTGRDDLEYHNTTKKNYLETAAQEFKSFAKKCGERYIFVNNRSKDSKCEWIEMYSAINKMLLQNQHSYYNNNLLQTLNEAFDEIIAERALVDTRIPVEKVAAAAEKEVENGGGILRTLLKSTSVGALTCGIFSAIFDLTIPVIAAGTIVGAGGAAIAVGGAALGAYAYKKKCTIS